jgi:3-oxoacyl-[acyl-carrier-protein] synthase-3
MVLPGFGCVIRGTGSALGSIEVSSTTLEERLGLRPGWIEERTGVRTRNVAAPGERTTELGVRAAKAALEDADLDPQRLGMVICATMTPEMPCPATGQRIADLIGAVPCGAFDITSACTGFLTGMNLAANTIRVGAAEHILVVGSDWLSPTIDPSDPKMVPLFGDAATAAVLSRCSDPHLGCQVQHINADGGQWASIYQPRCEADLPPGVKPPETYGYLTMNGLAVFRFAVETLIRIIPEALAAAKLTLEDADLILLHQSNLRIIDPVRQHLGLCEDRCPAIIHRTGNTSGGSVGLLLDSVRREGRLKSGMTVVLAAVGGGLSWGASVWRV